MSRGCSISSKRANRQTDYVLFRRSVPYTCRKPKADFIHKTPYAAGRSIFTPRGLCMMCFSNWLPSLPEVLKGIMAENLDICNAAVSLLIKADALAARLSGRIRKRSLRRWATTDAGCHSTVTPPSPSRRRARWCRCQSVVRISCSHDKYLLDIGSCTNYVHACLDWDGV